MTAQPPPATYSTSVAFHSGGQGVQPVRFPPCVCVAVGQGAQAMLPARGAYVSAAHTVQLTPAASGAVPAGHGAHVAAHVAVVFRTLPAGQRVQAAVPEGTYSPEAHGVQPVAYGRGVA